MAGGLIRRRTMRIQAITKCGKRHDLGVLQVSDLHIDRLRQALEKPWGASVIETVYNQGYRFIAYDADSPSL